MSKPKIAGCCSKCDAEVFEVKARNSERFPTQIDGPLDNARRVTFVLMSGSPMDLTLCESCVETLTPSDYYPLWQRVMAAWVSQSGKDHPWVKSQGENGIAGVLRIQHWKEVA